MSGHSLDPESVSFAVRVRPYVPAARAGVCESGNDDVEVKSGQSRSSSFRLDASRL